MPASYRPGPWDRAASLATGLGGFPTGPGVPSRPREWSLTLSGAQVVMALRRSRCLVVSTIRRKMMLRTSSASILFPGATGERHAVPRPIGNPEMALRALRHLLEQIGRRPVDEFHQETIRERADDLERHLAHAMRPRTRSRLRRMSTDAQRLGKAVGA